MLRNFLTSKESHEFFIFDLKHISLDALKKILWKSKDTPTEEDEEEELFSLERLLQINNQVYLHNYQVLIAKEICRHLIGYEDHELITDKEIEHGLLRAVS